MSEEEVEKLRLKIAGKIDSNGGSGNGIGLKNVQDRIHIAFGDQYGIEIASKLGCYTKLWSGFQSRIDSQRKMTRSISENKGTGDCDRREIQD